MSNVLSLEDAQALAARVTCDYCGSDLNDTKTWCEHCDPADAWDPYTEVPS